MGLNLEKEGPVRMAVGVTTCLRGSGCSTFPHTHTRSLAKPSQAKPSQAKPSQAKPSQAKLRHGWHGMACFGRPPPRKRRWGHVGHWTRGATLADVFGVAPPEPQGLGVEGIGAWVPKAHSPPPPLARPHPVVPRGPAGVRTGAWSPNTMAH